VGGRAAPGIGTRGTRQDWRRGNGVKAVNEWAVIIAVALAAQSEPTQARTQLDCATTKVIITATAGGDETVRAKEHISFLIDDAARTFTFADGRWLQVTRFDKSWISANSEDIQYEFNRGDGTLTYAGSTTKGSVTTTIIGSGRCEYASMEKT
jgi:hypothetical protein